ncbi:hypothetical protein BDZ89DRAFT_719614 [Hymenopellis radicata]|nr:hypothetical protein BDZ89DRAFT_719614 [Hymenopellis radicata]
MDSDSPLVAERTDQPMIASTPTDDGGDTIETLKLQITSLRNELTQKDNQHRLEMRKLSRDIYTLNRANEDLQSKNQQLTIEFNGRRHEFTTQQIDLQEREIDQHLELIGLSTSLKEIAGETDDALIATKITEQVLIVNTMAARRVAISDTHLRRSVNAPLTGLPRGAKSANENSRGVTSGSADRLGGEWSAMLQPVASSSAITPPGVNTSRGPVSTPSTPVRAGKRRGRPSKKSIDRNEVLDRNNVLERSLGDYPNNHVMESRTLVWGKSP